jgi:hypothetical protein
MAYNTIEELRAARNQALAETDWTMLSDNPLSIDEGRMEVFRLYRQQLRDLPQKAEKLGLENIELPPSPL